MKNYFFPVTADGHVLSLGFWWSFIGVVLEVPAGVENSPHHCIADWSCLADEDADFACKIKVRSLVDAVMIMWLFAEFLQ